MWYMNSSRISEFRQTAWTYYKKSGRDALLWRKTRNPYRILVSEMMLQQTQVLRVKEKYREFLKKFPTVSALARASLGDVLKVWSGLGYNRRGKYVHDAAKIIVEKYGGKVPRDIALLRALPGIGPYTASAVRVFAFNEPDTLIETNIRAAFIHYFYQGRSLVNDGQIIPIAQKAAEGQDPRTWHWALMDYGAHIKKLHKNPSRKSTHYVRQSKFEGSLRQVRGAILRELHKSSLAEKQLLARFNLASPKSDFGKQALAGLARDGLIVKRRGTWHISAE
jgi:A/G-specific adenine glycosylase